ncbi:MAG TPA: Ig-like domain-containing protein [Methylomirabilota bacterium]|nr:Ig-like domain-containing protein [Methylomirabilota bacterium]
MLVVLAQGLVRPDLAGSQSNVVGEWKLLPQKVPTNPIHAALLRTGRILIVSGSENDPTVTTYRAAVWDPVSGAFTVQNIPWDLFCNAMSFLPDGRVLTSGGNLQYNPFRGIRTTTIFDPANEQFTQVQDMAHGRWYPSNLALADGRTMTFSGWRESGGTNQAVELYTIPNGWGPEHDAPFVPSLYPWLHLLPGGGVFDAGAQITSHVYDPSTQSWSDVIATTAYQNERTYGSSVLLPLKPGDNYRARVMIMGGDNPATSSAEIIDLSADQPAWRTLPPMSAPRIQMSAVLLPSGKVLALGGSVQNNTASTASLGADLFDPDTETWSPAGTMLRPRLYHSVALLMPDATVWVAGSNPQQGTYDDTMEVYRPGYLFTAGGTAATRPVISSAPVRIGYGASFAVSTPDAANIGSVALVRAGSSTHAFNFEQRVVNLAFTAGSGTLTLTAPPDANVAPPGYYMLFVINRSGVPSVAAWVQVTGNPNNAPPHGTISNPGGDVTIRAGQTVTFAGSGTDSDGTIKSYFWSILGGAPASSTSATPGAVTFATAGVYDVMLTVTDNLGVTDPSPPHRRITVLPATITAGFSTPPANVTVAGTQPVTMTVAAASGSSNTFTLTIDGTQVFTTTTSGTSATFSWDTRTYTDGPHTLGVTVRDASGATASATRSVTVNNTATGNDIAVSFPNLTPGQSVQGLTTVRIATAGTLGASNRFSIQVDGAVVDTVVTDAATIDWPWNTVGLSNGSHTIGATVTDATGRVGTGTEYVTVQNSLRVVFTNPAAGATVSGTAWADVWVEGSVGTANVFTLTVGGTTIATTTTTGRHVTFAWDTTRTPNGPQTLVAQVRDAQNNGGQGTLAVTVQNGGASLAAAFTSPAAGATVNGSVAVGLSATGGTAPYTYRLTIDGTQVFTTTTAGSATFTWNTTTATNAAHTLGLTVTDSRSATATATRTVTVQNGAASLAAAFTSPAAGATVNGSVAVGLSATGGTGPYSYRLSIDGTQVFTTTTAASATFTWDTTTATNAAHTLGLTVTDSRSATATATRTVTVANGTTGTLGIFLTTPAAGSTVSGTVWVNVWVEGAAAGSNSYRMTVGSTTLWTQSSTATHVTLPWTTTSTPNGVQTLAVNVSDATGNTGRGTVTVNVQNGATPLTASITSPASGATVGGTVNVAMAASGGTPPYTYALKIDGTSAFTTTSSSGSATFAWNTSAVADGSHTLVLTVTDGAGTTASSSRTVTIANATSGTLDVALTTPAAGATVSGTVWVNIWVNGGSTGTKAYTMTVGGQTVWSESSTSSHVTLPWVTSSTPNGARTLVVTVQDPGTGTGTASVQVTVQNP